MTMTMTLEDPCTNTNGWVFGETPKGVGVISNLKISIHFPNKGAGGGGGGGLKAVWHFSKISSNSVGTGVPWLAQYVSSHWKWMKLMKTLETNVIVNPNWNNFITFTFFIISCIFRMANLHMADFYCYSNIQICSQFWNSLPWTFLLSPSSNIRMALPLIDYFV